MVQNVMRAREQAAAKWTVVDGAKHQKEFRTANPILTPL
jgi:hypothetical protein